LLAKTLEGSITAIVPQHEDDAILMCHLPHSQNLTTEELLMFFIATPWCTVQQILHEEKSKHAGLAEQNGFGPAFLHRMLRVAKGTVKAPVVDWLDGLIGPGGLLLVVSDLLQSQF
jgi:hypothetical protein